MYKERFKSHHDASRELKNFYKVDCNKDQYVYSSLNEENNNLKVIYIHVPFCNKICSFCPFHRPDSLKRTEYHKYIINELSVMKDFPYFKNGIDAINFGGGTPTALKPYQMKEILAYLKKNFKYNDDMEISVESSITEMTEEMMDVLIEGHVNRISFGVQTFNDERRKMLNRRGTGQQAIETIKKIISKGLTNTGIDLIYNYPGQTVEELKEDLKIIKSLNLAGISFYSLMLHESTPLYNKITKDEVDLMNDLNHEYELFETIIDELKDVGYEPLELTKLVRNNLDKYKYIAIRHNEGDCIAIGHGAGGNINGYIYRNTCDYPMIKNTSVGQMGRCVDKKYFILDHLINELQHTSIDLSLYEDKLGIPLFAILKPLLEKLIKEELIIRNNNEISFTKKGIFFGNNIIADFIHEIISYDYKN